jgi:hypothetical protein
VDDKLEVLESQVLGLTARMDGFSKQWEERLDQERQRYVSFIDACRGGEAQGFPDRNDELTRILERVVEIGLRGGWVEFQDTPLQLPRIQLSPPPSPARSDPSLDAQTP